MTFPLIFTFLLGVNCMYLKQNTYKKHPTPKTLQDPLALQSVQFLPAALGLSQQFLHLLDHLKKRETFFHFTEFILDTFSLTNHKNQRHDEGILDGIRCIWTSVVWCPLVIGGSRGTASWKICSSSDSTRFITSPLSSCTGLASRDRILTLATPANLCR